MSTVAHIVKQKRKEKKLSLREVAKKAGVSYQTVFSIEHGDGSQDAAMKVMKALGVSVKERLALIMSLVRRQLAA